MTESSQDDKSSAGPTDDETGAERDVCRSTVSVQELNIDDPQLIYEPWAVEQPGEIIEIWARREDPEVIPWGFWGGVTAALVVGYVLFSGALSGAAVRFDVQDVLLVLGLLVAGMVMYRLGRRSTLEDSLLCELDVGRQIISWPTDADGSLIAVAFHDVRELTFAIVDAPVDNSKAGTRLDAATVRIIDDRGREIPVVEASTSKAEAHQVARLLSDVVGPSINYVGTGVKEWV